MAMKSLVDAGPDGLRLLWDRLSRVPGGKRAFSAILGRMAPYTGTVGAEVVELRRGFGRVELRDRRAVRNHLGSVHAIALMNLAEMASGVAMIYSLPSNTRGIIKGLSMSYLKKARGTLTATAAFVPVATNEKQDVTLTVEVTDPQGEIVATATADWRIGPM
ncbi:MAG: PaaI family thioesterase [Myxococcales bacterium]|nr:PaaI family thioesterase [Myxococcales bacterium]